MTFVCRLPSYLGITFKTSIFANFRRLPRRNDAVIILLFVLIVCNYIVAAFGRNKVYIYSSFCLPLSPTRFLKILSSFSVSQHDNCRFGVGLLPRHLSGCHHYCWMTNGKILAKNYFDK
jgi:hypothetical protein